MKDVIPRSHETKKDGPIMAATKLFRDIIKRHPIEDRNGRIYHFILVHVLMQMKSSLFSVLLNSFHGRYRRHGIRAIKMFERKPAMLYTMTVKSLIHCCNNFDQNTKILSETFCGES